MLEVKNISKEFGKLKAVDNINFQALPGRVLGVVGQNGSGKTTLFRMILNLLTPEVGGSVKWNGKDITLDDADNLGYLPEERGLYPDLTIEQQIRYFARLRGLSDKDIDERIDYWLDLFQVKGDRKTVVKKLSKGNQQKVQLITALIHEPDLAILDEPFSGLDPVNADLLKKGILELRDKGSVIIFSSHNMNNVEEVCDDLLMIHFGKQELYGEINEVRREFGRTKIYLEAPGWTKEELEQLDGVKRVEVKSNTKEFLLILEDESYGPAIFDTVTKGEYVPIFSQEAPSLDEIFRWKVGEKNA